MRELSQLQSYRDKKLVADSNKKRTSSSFRKMEPCFYLVKSMFRNYQKKHKDYEVF